MFHPIHLRTSRCIACPTTIGYGEHVCYLAGPCCGSPCVPVTAATALCRRHHHMSRCTRDGNGQDATHVRPPISVRPYSYQTMDGDTLRLPIICTDDTQSMVPQHTTPHPYMRMVVARFPGLPGHIAETAKVTLGIPIALTGNHHGTSWNSLVAIHAHHGWVRTYDVLLNVMRHVIQFSLW